MLTFPFSGVQCWESISPPLVCKFLVWVYSGDTVGIGGIIKKGVKHSCQRNVGIFGDGKQSILQTYLKFSSSRSWKFKKRLDSGGKTLLGNGAVSVPQTLLFEVSHWVRLGVSLPQSGWPRQPRGDSWRIWGGWNTHNKFLENKGGGGEAQPTPISFLLNTKWELQRTLLFPFLPLETIIRATDLI